MDSPNITTKQLAARMRLQHVLARHTREEDIDLSDDAFIRAVWARYLKEREVPLIDPTE